MKLISRTTQLIILTAAISLVAAAQSPQKSIEQVQQSIADAYKARTLSTLDSQKLINGSFLLVLENSLGEGKDQYVKRRFRTFAQLDAWLKKRETEEGAPFRQLMPLKKCARGRCAYDFDNGILHNQLYLHDLYYGFRHGRLYIVKLHLLDGDYKPVSTLTNKS